MKTSSKKTLERSAKQQSFFRSRYVVFAAFVLLVTSLLWSIIGANLQSTNADQLINSYLFDSGETLRSALFPGAHTFLIKWPLFIVERLMGHSEIVLTMLTVLVSLVTVAGIVYIMYRIDRRPLVFGTVMLGLAGVLLMIPAQPHSGGLLPLNFAMLTTRNIEYLFYILGLIWIVKAHRLRSWLFIGSVAVLGLLIASDKLFLWISAGGAVITLLVYGITRRPAFVRLAVRWLVATILAGLISMGILWAIGATGLTHIIGDSAPYGFVSSIKQFGMGLLFAVLGLLTNFGANIVYDIGIIKDLPSAFVSRLASPFIVTTIINLGLVAIGLVASIKLLISSFVSSKKTKLKKRLEPDFSVASALSTTLITSTLAAVGLFIISDHYYPVDARYLTIGLFALCVVIVTYIRSRPLMSIARLRIVGGLLVVGIILGSLWTITTYQQQSGALQTINARNTKIVNAMAGHKTDLLVGDYWRVVPIHQIDTQKNSQILPLSDCTSVRSSLISTKWRDNFEQNSFTYLLTLEKGLTDYPACTIEQVIQAYGRPNASALIAGTNEKPVELLLFFDQGATKNRRITNVLKAPTILPTAISQVKTTDDCVDGTTVLNIVAHQDDDILFMNPDVIHHIDAGHCVRTVYMTSGDAGQNSDYWLSRERASEAAYESMLGIDKQSTIWIQRTVKINENQFVTIANPKGNKRISLIFMRLPDGNLNGQGFSPFAYDSLTKLLSGKISYIKAVDDQSQYSLTELTGVLTSLMYLYRPTIINSQSPSDGGKVYRDHQDHISAGYFADRAYDAYAAKDKASLKHYIGYAVREYAINVFGLDLKRTTDAFLAYANHDKAVCQTKYTCDKTGTYNAYLHRQYVQPH